jgi:Skp family chaperone for outer membrane proteins
MRKFILITISLAVIMTATSSPAAEEVSAAGQKYGWVDLKKVLKTYYKTDIMLKQFDEAKLAKEAEVNKIVEEIENMEAGLLLLTPKARKETEGDILKKKYEVNAMIQEAEEELGNESMVKQEELLKEVIDAAEKVATEKGYSFIFTGEILIYKEPSMDCSDAILAILNKGHETAD